MDANERDCSQRRELRDYWRLFRSVQREGLRVPRTGLSGVPANRVRASTHPSNREAGSDAQLSGTHAIADLSGGLCLLRQNYHRAESDRGARRRTPRATPKLPSRDWFPTRSARELRPLIRDWNTSASQGRKANREMTKSPSDSFAFIR